MLYLHSLDDASAVFRALGTATRIQIMQLIYENPAMTMNELARELGITNSAVSMHVGKFQEAGLVTIETTTGRRGIAKIVRPAHNRLVVDMSPAPVKIDNCYQDDIKVGYYTRAQIQPVCGLATASGIIGELNDPKVFSYPERFDADILWLRSGSIRYNLPNRLKPGQTVSKLQFSFEISSKSAVGFGECPSDIYFSLNDVPIGKWTSPGDFGFRRGIISPLWWPSDLNQFGRLQSVVVGETGTFTDGVRRISDVTIHDLHIDSNTAINFTFTVPEDSANSGGLTIFGESFGDYSQNIRMRMYYEE